MSNSLIDLDQPPKTLANSVGEELSFVEMGVVLSRAKKWIAKFTLAAVLLTTIVVFLLPKKYTATARVMPPQQNQSTATMLLSQITGLTGALGGAMGSSLGNSLGLKNPSDLYVAILKSQTVVDSVIKKFELGKVYDEDNLIDTRKKLGRYVSINSGNEGVITIDVEDKDPKRAAAMADQFVVELDRVVKTLAITDASQRRLFFERQIANTKEELARAEVEFKKTQQSTGILVPGDQARAMVEGIARLKATISAREVQLTALRTFASDQHPELVLIQRELAELRAQLARLEKDAPVREGDIIVPTSRVPEATLEYLRKYRDLKFAETLYEMLVKQLALARIDEAKDAPLIQQLDKAVIPDKKSFPKRGLIIGLAGFAALLSSAFLALVHHSVEGKRSDPVYAAKLHEIALHWRLR